MNDTTNTERAAFEAWVESGLRKAYPRMPEDSVQRKLWKHGDDYMDMQTQHDWAVWQAARATQAAPASPEPDAMYGALLDFAIKVATANPQAMTALGEIVEDANKMLEHYPLIVSDRAPASPNTGAVPDGWQLVPKEPTEAMQRAWDCYSMSTAQVYRAMLAAAPSPSKGGEAAPADPCPQCQPGGVCKTPTCGRLRSSELMALYGTGKGGEADSEPDYAALERELLGDFDKKTGIYAKDK